uniref:Methyltransferase type 11 domain-containing protein n=1 Tax=Tetraselmis sp. GSL018 TaxID=582737 RepID=A0A061QQE2_9CHLO
MGHDNPESPAVQPALCPRQGLGVSRGGEPHPRPASLVAVRPIPRLLRLHLPLPDRRVVLEQVRLHLRDLDGDALPRPAGRHAEAVARTTPLLAPGDPCGSSRPVGCGTGRFHTFIKDNYPSMRTAALDLSPYYLQAARDNVDYWRRIAGPSSAAPTAFLHAAAESVPMEDSSADVVMSVYMFHEMPRHAQEAAAAEMARVLRPGGLLVLCDSIQRGDRPAFDGRITNFSRFNEPHYEAFVDADFGGMFEALGMRPYMKNMASSTKVLSFVKEAKAE